jgi:uracil-DNA glycosylase family 4
MSTQDDLKALNKKLQAASARLPLAGTPAAIVPGEGPITAEIMFIGEAPGYHESVQRRPFVGRSGMFFRETLRQVGISDETVYISNIIKARPPDNRDPVPAEISAYKPYLDEEINLIDPVLIVTLGRFSMAKFLPDARISQVHGRLHKVGWNGRKRFVLPMYHPAAGLRSTQVKNAFIKDFEKIPKAVAWIKDHHLDLQLEEEVRDALF